MQAKRAIKQDRLIEIASTSYAMWRSLEIFEGLHACKKSPGASLHHEKLKELERK